MAAARGLSAAGAPAHRLRVNLGDRDLIAAASPPPPAAGAGTRTLDSSPVAERARDVASLRERRLDVGGALGVDALAAEPSHHDIPAHRPHLRAEVSSVDIYSFGTSIDHEPSAKISDRPTRFQELSAAVAEDIEEHLEVGGGLPLRPLSVLHDDLAHSHGILRFGREPRRAQVLIGDFAGTIIDQPSAGAV